MKTVEVRSITWLLVIGLVSIFYVTVSTAQTNTLKPLPPPQSAADVSADKGAVNDQRTPLTTFEEEMRTKRLIKLAEKEHQENLNRAREVSQLAQDLKTVLQDRTSLDREDTKKLDRLEKLTKKIRSEAGGEEDEVQIGNAPSDIPAAASQIADAATQLSKDVLKTPRQVVSTSVIDRANVLLQLVRILRGFTRRF